MGYECEQHGWKAHFKPCPTCASEFQIVSGADSTGLVYGISDDRVFMEKIRQLEAENAQLKETLRIIDNDGPELSCPFIDGVIRRFPETAITLERIRTINTQLRYNLNATKEFNADLKEKLAIADSTIELLKTSIKNLENVILKHNEVCPVLMEKLK